MEKYATSLGEEPTLRLMSQVYVEGQMGQKVEIEEQSMQRLIAEVSRFRPPIRALAHLFCNR